MSRMTCRASAYLSVPDEVTGPARWIFATTSSRVGSTWERARCAAWGANPISPTRLSSPGVVLSPSRPMPSGSRNRNWSQGTNVTWFELSSRLVDGRTLLADCLQEISVDLRPSQRLP